MRLEIIDPVNQQLWNNTVNHAINGSLFHTWEWLKIVEKHSNSKLIPLVFFDSDDEKPFGVVPLFLMQKLGLKMFFSPPPGSSITLGPIFINKNYSQHKFEMAYLDFQALIDGYIKKFRANYSYMVTSPGFIDMRPFTWAGYEVTPCYTYKIDLSQGESFVWNSFSRTLKQDISRALAKGLQVIESQDTRSEDMDYIYNSLNERYQKQNLNFNLQKEYLEEIIQTFGKSSLAIYLAVFQGKTIGGTIFSKYKDTISAWVGAVRPESNNLEVNGCIYKSVIHRAIQEGYKWFEIMGANTPHLCASKAKYNPSLVIHFQIKKADILGMLAEKGFTLRKYFK